MKCLHMSGAGNDFMVIDARGRETELDFAKLAIMLCAASVLLTTIWFKTLRPLWRI